MEHSPPKAAALPPGTCIIAQYALAGDPCSSPAHPFACPTSCAFASGRCELRTRPISVGVVDLCPSLSSSQCGLATAYVYETAEFLCCQK